MKGIALLFTLVFALYAWTPFGFRKSVGKRVGCSNVGGNTVGDLFVSPIGTNKLKVLYADGNGSFWVVKPGDSIRLPMNPHSSTKASVTVEIYNCGIGGSWEARP